MYDTVIFDLDGTLMDTLVDLMNSVNHALAANHFPERTLDEVRFFVGNGIRKLIERAVPEGISGEVQEQVYRDFSEHYAVHCNDHTGPYTGIPELLAELKKRGVKLGIASNKNRENVLALKEIYFQGIFTGAAGAVDAKPKKPDPYMVELMLQELQSEKAKTLYVGDSQVDVQTAKNTGLDMVAVLWGFRTKEELKEAGATNFVAHPLELLQYLD